MITIFIINLDRSVDRLKQASQAIWRENFSFERISAVDGLKIDKIEQAKPVNQSFGDYFQPLTAGEIGCFLSHVKTLQIMIDRKIDTALILEDDFKLSSQFNKQIEALISDKNNLPDVIKICCSRRRGEIIRELADGSRIIRSTSAPITTGAAVWTLNGAIKFMNSFNQIKRPIDVQLKHWWEHSLDICWMDPPPVQLRLNEITSTIGNRKNKRINSRIKKIIYRISYFFLREWKYMRRYGINSWIKSFRKV